MECNDVQQLEIATTKSDAIILGKLESIETIIYNTTHHGKKEHFTGKFKVIKSWKLVNKKFVSINLPGKSTPCVRFEEGKKYLVFAQNDSENLFINLDSRTSDLLSENSQNDLQRLTEKTIPLENGEFSLQHSPFWDVSIAVLIMSICGVLIYFWVKKNI